MTVYRLTVKGQVTIPKEVREALALREGDGVFFSVENGYAIIRPVQQRPLASLRGAIPAIQPYPGDDVIDAIVQKHVAREALSVREEEQNS